jgi:hypothetical protein
MRVPQLQQAGDLLGGVCQVEHCHRQRRHNAKRQAQPRLLAPG